MATCTALGLLNAYHFYLNGAANGRHDLLLPRLVEELTGAWSAGLLMLPLTSALRRLRIEPRRMRRYAGYLALLPLFSVLHTSLMWASRTLAFPQLGLGSYHYGVMPWRYAMEFPSDVIVYVLTACLVWLLDHYRASRARELRAAQLESALADARLEALRLQLNPHFLFNALNAVSATMYEQPRAADEMLARIGDLLRATLQADTQEHTLADELRLLALYLDIQRARFGDRLQVRVDIAPGLDAARVPFLVLQPLVENAIEHAGGSTRHRLGIHAAIHRGVLELRVRNQDAATGTAHRGHGIGLGNTQARLLHLYGGDAGLALEALEDGSTQARLWLPRRGAAVP
ncbi:sensor histidine kinase [Frateuria defendens]|uniref:sensor histidine kinase n=1 Tax=Frateuria defendens TaxID=2219559 RepID=UPI00066FDD09|nr:histidine kinase [Frateuria defendens]